MDDKKDTEHQTLSGHHVGMRGAGASVFREGMG